MHGRKATVKRLKGDVRHLKTPTDLSRICYPGMEFNRFAATSWEDFLSKSLIESPPSTRPVRYGLV